MKMKNLVLADQKKKINKNEREKMMKGTSVIFYNT